MKKIVLVVSAFLTFSTMLVTQSCKNKKDQPSTQQDTTNKVEISSDETLRTSVNDVVKAYQDVKAEIKDGVVTLKGSVKQDELQQLISRIQELKPRKVENELVIKTGA